MILAVRSVQSLISLYFIPLTPSMHILLSITIDANIVDMPSKQSPWYNFYTVHPIMFKFSGFVMIPLFDRMFLSMTIVVGLD